MAIKTFRQFIAEIDHDDSIFTKDASSWTAANFRLDDRYKPLPLKTPFWKPGFVCYWYHRGGGIFKLAVAKGNKVVIAMELDVIKKRVPGGELTGLEVDSLSSLEEGRGTGLVLRTYEALVESGQVLFSSDSQTSGSRHLWEKLVKSPKVVPFVFAHDAAASWYIRRFGSDELKEKPPANVLLVGPMGKMIDEAYASQETRWLVVPTDLTGLSGLQDGAINLG